MKQAIILAAGEGQRLRPFTVNRPKAMLSIADKPILEYVIEALAESGIRNIVLVVGYRKDQVFDYMGTGEQLGVTIQYVTQKEQLGTAHALAQARELAEDEFLVMSGDKLVQADVITQIAGSGPDALVVKRVPNPNRYGVVVVERGRVREIIEKPREATTNLVNIGMYAFNKDVFEFIEGELNIPDALNAMACRGVAIKALETDGLWLDVVYPWDILGLNNAVLSRIRPGLNGTIETGVSLKGQVHVGKGTVIRSNSYIVGPVVVGEGCEIGPNVCILPATSIGDNVVISPFTEIKNSVIGNDVNIGPSSIIHDSVIDKGCMIQAHFTACCAQSEVRVNEEYHRATIGAMLGEGCRLGNSVVAQPGVLVGNYCRIQALKLISGVLPDKSMVL